MSLCGGHYDNGVQYGGHLDVLIACIVCITAVVWGPFFLVYKGLRWFFVGPPSDKRLDDMSLFEPDHTTIEIPGPCNIEQTLMVMKVEARQRIVRRQRAEMFRQANRIPVRTFAGESYAIALLAEVREDVLPYAKPGEVIPVKEPGCLTTYTWSEYYDAL
jgi:hypothetical protein